jgi:shikimate 5-dehydrogenase
VDQLYLEGDADIDTAALEFRLWSEGGSVLHEGDSLAVRVADGNTHVQLDVVYRPRRTPFLDAARRRGLVAEDGLGMLVEQAALALHLWLGASAPRDVMARAAEDALALPPA